MVDEEKTGVADGSSVPDEAPNEAPPALPDAPPVIHPNHKAAFEALEKALMPYRTDDPIAGSCVLVTTTPGIGKTRVGIHLGAMKAVDDLRGMWASSTRNMAWQAHDRFKAEEYGAQVLMLEGRHNGYTRKRLEKDGTETEVEVTPNCQRYERIAMARERGYPARTYVCNGCIHCPTHRDKNGEKPPSDQWCRYFKVFYEACGLPNGEQKHGYSGYVTDSEITVAIHKMSKIIVTTHHMAAAMIADGEMLKPDWFICDEDPIAALRETYTWNEKELSRDVDGDQFIVFRALLNRTVVLVKKFLAQSLWEEESQTSTCKTTAIIRQDIHDATEYHHTTLSGIGLARFLHVASKQLKVNLKAILQATASAMPPVGPGQLLHMEPEKFARLPHFKEIDLAAEMLNVLETAEGGTEVAYKVSLRKAPDSSWAFVWDHVRRVSYEGPMILLDAYGSAEIVKRYTGRTVTNIDVKCKVRDNVKVRIYPEVGTNRSNLDDPEAREETFDDWLLPELRRHENKKVLIYTQKRYAKWLEEKIAAEGDTLNFVALQFKWFWMDRGDDNYANFDTVIIFGTPIPNVIAEKQFANALYAGEEPISWDTDCNNQYKDIRAREHTKARQQNEMLQCVYRLRPALPNPKAQEIVIFSRMKLPLEIELNGASHEKRSECHDEIGRFATGVSHIYRELGCYVDAFSAFIGIHDEFISWGNGENAELPLEYDAYKRRNSRILRTRAYRNGRTVAMRHLCSTGAEPVPCKKTLYRGALINYFGDEGKAHTLLDRIWMATREPGVDMETVEDTGRHGAKPGTWQAQMPSQAFKKALVIENVVRTLQGELFFGGQWHPSEWMPSDLQYIVDDLHLEYPAIIGPHRMLSIKCYFEERGFTAIPDPINESKEFAGFLRSHLDIYNDIMAETKGMTEAKTIDEFVEEKAEAEAEASDEAPAIPQNVYDIGVDPAKTASDKSCGVIKELDQPASVIPFAGFSSDSAGGDVSVGEDVGEGDDSSSSSPPADDDSGGESGPDPPDTPEGDTS